MAVMMKGLQPILKCKHCKQNPIIELTQVDVMGWSGTSVQMHKASVRCPTESSTLFSEYAAADSNHAFYYAFHYWNRQFGETT